MEQKEDYSVTRSASASLWVCHCGWEQCESGHSFGPAVRDHFLIHYVEKGNGWYKNFKKEYALKQGDGFLITPGETSLYHAALDTPWEYSWVGFRGTDAQRLLELCGLSRETPVFHADPGRMRPLLRKLLEAYRIPNAPEYAMLAYLYLIFSELMAGQGPRSRPSEPAELYLSRAVEYIHDNYSYQITVEGIASYIGIDRTYLYRIFQEPMGISPTRYLLKVRMTRAADLLKNPEYSVTQVAASAGYRELPHFSNNFKRFFGISPMLYRKQFFP